MKKPMITSRTNQLSFVMIAAAIARAVGVDFPEEVFYSLEGLILIFLRRGVEETKNSVTRL